MGRVSRVGLRGRRFTPPALFCVREADLQVRLQGGLKTALYIRHRRVNGVRAVMPLPSVTVMI